MNFRTVTDSKAKGCNAVKLKKPPLFINERPNSETSQSYGALRVFTLSVPAFLLLVFMCPPGFARNINWEGLNLSPQQESQIHQLEDSWEKTHEQVSVQIERDTAELRAILPTGDIQRIRLLQNRITSNKMYLMNQSMDTFLKKRDALTPTQRTELQKMMPGKGN